MAKKLKIPRKIRGKMSSNMRKMIEEWRETGKITTSRATYRPKTLSQAMKQAAAIEYGRYGIGKAGKGKRGRKGLRRMIREKAKEL